MRRQLHLLREIHIQNTVFGKMFWQSSSKIMHICKLQIWNME